MIRYHPIDLLKKIAPESKIKKLVTPRLTMKKAALSFISDIPFLSEKSVQQTALKVIKGYKERFDQAVDDGASVPAATTEALDDKKLLVNRVQNEIVSQIADQIKDSYSGEYYRWLPSDALNPDPLHQLKYGKRYQIGKGEMPGDRYGCRCGMQILVKETKLDL